MIIIIFKESILGNIILVYKKKEKLKIRKILND
jgi:hypothetical protein